MLYSLDRFEGDVAVLVDDDGSCRNVLRSALPDGVRTGDLFREQDGTFTPDPAATAARRERVLRLQRSLRRRNK